YATRKRRVGRCLERTKMARNNQPQITPMTRITDHSVRATQRERASAFTLLELLVVVGIIALLLVLTAPAFTYIKGGTDITSAAYTIKGALDTARTYAQANN